MTVDWPTAVTSFLSALAAFGLLIVAVMKLKPDIFNSNAQGKQAEAYAEKAEAETHKSGIEEDGLELDNLGKIRQLLNELAADNARITAEMVAVKIDLRNREYDGKVQAMEISRLQAQNLDQQRQLDEARAERERERRDADARAATLNADIAAQHEQIVKQSEQIEILTNNVTTLTARIEAMNDTDRNLRTSILSLVDMKAGQVLDGLKKLVKKINEVHTDILAIAHAVQESERTAVINRAATKELELAATIGNLVVLVEDGAQQVHELVENKQAASGIAKDGKS